MWKNPFAATISLLVSIAVSGAALAQVPATFDLKPLMANDTWGGPFQGVNCCKGADRLKFTVAGGQLVSVHAWSKQSDDYFRNPYLRDLVMNDFGELPADKITFTKDGEMVLLHPGQISFTFKLVGEVIKGRNDPRINPDHRHWSVVDFELKPLRK